MSGDELHTRTDAFVLRVIRLVEALPPGRTAGVIGKPLVRSATSVSAHYRAARRAKSLDGFIAKMKIVEEEGDEPLRWLEPLVESGFVPEHRLTGLMAEGNALVAMTVASIKTVRNQKSQPAGGG